MNQYMKQNQRKPKLHKKYEENIKKSKKVFQEHLQNTS